MIPKVETISLISGDNTILTVPSNKVIEIHEISVDNRDVASHTFVAKITRSAITINFANPVVLAGIAISILTSPNKKTIAMDGDVIKINQIGGQDVAAPTASIHYTEWNVGEVSGVEPKSVIGTITSTGLTTIISTSASAPQRLVIRDFLIEVVDLVGGSLTVIGALQTSAIVVAVERFITPFSEVSTNTVQRWVLEQKGATVMNWQQAKVGFLGTAKFILSYIEHSDL